MQAKQENCRISHILGSTGTKP